MTVFEVLPALPSAVRTANGQGAAVGAGLARTLELALAVTAASGTSPTLDARIEWSHDGGQTWFTVAGDAFAQATGAATLHKQVRVRGPLYRVTWTVGGTTPSFTFGVTAYGS